MTGRREDNSVIPFINLVKAHECIWNYSIAEYRKIEVTSAAWREIASEINDTEKNCRERWKNIRTAYVRSLKPPKSGARRNSKKSYYLTEHLAFLQPYLKGGDSYDDLHDPDHQSDGDETEFVKVEMRDEATSVHSIEKTPRKSSDETQKNRKRKDHVDDTFIEWRKIKKIVDKNDQDAEKYFLLSLLPDLKKLGARRKRTFKMQTMSLLHNLLEEDERENVESSISLASSPSV